jgi:hypothetical protein
MSIFNWFKKKNTENIFQQFLALPFAPGVDLFKEFPKDPDCSKHIQVSQELLNKEFVEFFSNFDIEMNRWEAFYTAPFGKIWVHTDTDGFGDAAKINWTWGDSLSETCWWDIKDRSRLEPIVTDFGIKYLKAEEEDCKLLFKQQMTKPSIVQVGILHSTNNPTPTGRWTLCLPLIYPGTTQRLPWNRATEMFADYLEVS